MKYSNLEIKHAMQLCISRYTLVYLTLGMSIYKNCQISAQTVIHLLTWDMILYSIFIKSHLLEGLRPTIVPRYLNIKENTNLDNVDIFQRLTCSQEKSPPLTIRCFLFDNFPSNVTYLKKQLMIRAANKTQVSITHIFLHLIFDLDAKGHKSLSSSTNEIVK